MELKGTIESRAWSFTRTLPHKDGEVPILFAHASRQPIGLGKVTETSKGLQIEGEIVRSVDCDLPDE